MPGIDGLLHISQIAETRVEKVSDFLKEGDKLTVKVMGVDARGKIDLVRPELEGKVAPRAPKPERNGGSGGGRGFDRERSNDRGFDRGRSNDRPSSSDRPRGERPRDERPRTDRPSSDRPRDDKPREDRPKRDDDLSQYEDKSNK